MKRLRPNKDSAYTQVTKKSRLASTSTSAGTLRVEQAYRSNSSAAQSDADDDIHPNVLLKRLLSEKLEKMVEKYCLGTRPLRNISGEKIIPTFDPDDHECNVKNWLAKIDQLALVHKWDDYSKIVIMQTRLAGQAKLWFNRLDEYDHTWEEWKLLLIQAFPRSFEYADMLEELVGRKKLHTETITHYYHDKLAMCRRCRLDDAASLSCLIKGLPTDLQNNAKAYKCETPEEFYSGYLSAFENYRNKVDGRKFEMSNTNYSRVTKPEVEKRRIHEPSLPSTSRPFSTTMPRRMNCFRCNSLDHIVKDCPVPDRRICKFCSEVGHNINRCPKIENLMKRGKGEAIPINIVQNLNDIYKKEVNIGGKTFCGYLDTGAQLNVASLKMVNSLQYTVKETDAMLKGFTGDIVPAIGQINLTMTIDGLDFETTAVVTHKELPADVDILIGQPVINHDGISLVTTWRSATLKEETMYEDDVDKKYKITTCHDIQISPQESLFIEVNVLGNTPDCDVCTSPRLYDMGNKYYVVPATLLTGQSGHMKVYNMGMEDVTWRKGDVITRAVPCVVPAVGNNISPSERINSTKLGANETEVIRQCFTQYKIEEVFLSFNGGKDCTVLLDITLNILRELHNRTDVGEDLKVIYIRTNGPFREIETFVRDVEKHYGVKLMVTDGELRSTLKRLLEEDANLKACLMGTRRSDPYSANLNFMQKTDPSWPQIVRVSPLLNWSYHQIWSYILQRQVPYCSLYNDGYTSIGSTSNTWPNPALAYKDSYGCLAYRPAWTLADASLERAGRGTAPPKDTTSNGHAYEVIDSYIKGDGTII